MGKWLIVVLRYVYVRMHSNFWIIFMSVKIAIILYVELVQMMPFLVYKLVIVLVKPVIRKGNV